MEFVDAEGAEGLEMLELVEVESGISGLPLILEGLDVSSSVQQRQAPSILGF